MKLALRCVVFRIEIVFVDRLALCRSDAGRQARFALEAMEIIYYYYYYFVKRNWKNGLKVMKNNFLLNVSTKYLPLRKSLSCLVFRESRLHGQLIFQVSIANKYCVLVGIVYKMINCWCTVKKLIWNILGRIFCNKIFQQLVLETWKFLTLKPTNLTANYRPCSVSIIC